MPGSREKQLAKNTFIISIGRMASQSVSFLLLPFYTYILSVEQYGAVDVLNTIISLGLPIISMQLEQAVFRYLVEARHKDSRDESSIIVTGLTCVATQSLIGILVCLVASFFFKNEYTWFLAANVVFAVFAAMTLQISRGLGRVFDYSLASFIGSVITIMSNIICLGVFGMGVQGMLVGNIIGQASITIFLSVRLKIFTRFKGSKYQSASAKELRKYALPLVPNELSWWVFNASDRMIVSVFLGLSANGILAAASKLSTIFVSVYNVFYIGWVESISLHINDKDIEDYFNKIFNLVLRIFYFAMMLVLSFMWIIYPIMVNERYDEGVNLVPILMIGAFFNIVVGLLGSLYVAKKDTKAIAGTSIMAAIINVVTHLLLINFVGVFAAVISTAISFTALALYRAYDVRKKYNIKVEFRKAWLGLGIFVSVLFAYYSNTLVLKLFCGIAIVSLTIIFVSKYLKMIVQVLIRKVKKDQ